MLIYEALEELVLDLAQEVELAALQDPQVGLVELHQPLWVVECVSY